VRDDRAEHGIPQELQSLIGTPIDGVALCGI